MNIHMLALLLLIGRIIATFFIVLVLRRQLQLFKFTITSSLTRFRRNLFLLALAIFFGQFIPILIDTLTLIANINRANPTTIGVAYAVSNCVTAILSAILIWTLYSMAKSVKLNSDQIEEGLISQNQALRHNQK